ncbi:MAG: saccharopine dehydrogenase NADP-binding domain-containing protein [Sneathiellales bacterium]|nr:saccharopine dehydrogenase NADP-binding domain-containing protein [Sneathiellales bacterium]
MKPVLVLGGYGNFGKRIVAALISSEIPTIIAGRSSEKACDFAVGLKSDHVSVAVFDAFADLGKQLEDLQPSVVINTCGPFQNNDYSILETCLKHSVPYIDLADGREFVNGVVRYHEDAVRANTCLISGASTVPALSSAVIEHFKEDFSEFSKIRFGISPGQKAERGLATTQGILSYTGRPLKPSAGSVQTRYGWQDLQKVNFPTLGARWMSNCDIPDLDLLPRKYGFEEVRFSAGLELGIIHLGLWGLSWLIRLGFPLYLENHAAFLLKMSNFFDRFGSVDGGMFVDLEGLDKEGKPCRRKWFIEAYDGDGPHIPTIPAIILARKIAQAEPMASGAFPCLGLVTLEEYLEELLTRKFKTFQS